MEIKCELGLVYSGVDKRRPRENLGSEDAFAEGGCGRLAVSSLLRKVTCGHRALQILLGLQQKVHQQ